MGTFYNPSAGNALANSTVSIDDSRRVFNFGDRVSELAPQQSPFFVYLSKVAKKATDDPVFKFLEQRHQWQRRNFEMHTAFTASEDFDSLEQLNDSEDMVFTCKYDKYGNIAAANICEFMVPGSVLAIKGDDGEVYAFAISQSATVDKGTSPTLGGTVVGHDTDDNKTTVEGLALTCVGKQVPSGTVFSIGNKGQVIGSAWAEGTDTPVGWEDSMYDREGYCQIFKTAMNLFSGTAMATGYRGIKDEYKRVWSEKLMEHKMDLEQAFLFGRGSASNSELSSSTAPVRYTHGIVPYTEANGKVYNMSYASSGYDAFLDAMEDFFAPEGGNSGNKLVLASRKVITYLNKLGAGSFMNNSIGSSQYRLDVQNVPGAFGHQVTMVNTIYGNLHFVAEPLLRGPWEDYCVCVDMANVAYRPLVGNGISRDTFIETNIQANDEDGRRDQVITEAGLEISLPETHAVLKFS